MPDAPAIDRAALLARYRTLTQDVLPERAKRERWVVRDDHCFQRIVLDHAVGAAWPTVLVARAAAWRQLDDAQLRAAVDVAESIASGGGARLRGLNAQSLEWRKRRATTGR